MAYELALAELFDDSYEANDIGRYPIFVLNYGPSELPPAAIALKPEVRMMAFEALSRIQRALENQSQLEAQHKKLLMSMEGKHVEVEALRAALTEHDQRNRDFLLSCLKAFPRTMAPTATSAAKAAKVFGIPELFEMILSHLSVDDILAVTQINRRSSDIFRNSSALQVRTMQLVPTKSHFFHPWPHVPEGDRTQFTMPGLQIFVDLCVSEHIRGAGFNEFPLQFIFNPHKKLPKIGSVGKRMQLVYPPVHSMVVSRTCCDSTSDEHYDDDGWVAAVLERAHGDHGSDQWSDEEGDIMSIHSEIASQSDTGSPQAEEDQSELGQPSDQAGGDDDDYEADEPTAFIDPSLETEVDDFTISADVDDKLRIRCSTGLTIKHLLKATQLVREKHRNCPFAPRELHDRDGNVAMEVCFHAMPRLGRDDPYLIERDRKETRNEMAQMSDEGELTHESLLSSFVKSKRRAGQRGWPIMTLEDFRRKHGVTEKDGKLEVKIDPWDDDFEPPFEYSPYGRCRD